MKNKVITKVVIGIAFIIVMLLGLLVYNMAAKNSDYENALKRQGQIQGSWTFDGHTFLSIDNIKNSISFSVVKDRQEITRGTVKKTDDNYYLLYDEATNDLYAKIIPSYKKIYMIHKNLDITEMQYFSEALIGAAKNSEK